MNILDKQVHVTQFAKPGHFNDLDMLQVGNGGLMYEEEVSLIIIHSFVTLQIAHFSLWAALKSPLLISTDLTRITQASLDILMNTEIIAINQDPLGKSAHLVYRGYNNGWLGLGKKVKYDIWAGDLVNGEYVVSMAFFYSSNEISHTEPVS